MFLPFKKYSFAILTIFSEKFWSFKVGKICERTESPSIKFIFSSYNDRITEWTKSFLPIDDESKDFLSLFGFKRVSLNDLFSIYGIITSSKNPPFI